MLKHLFLGSLAVALLAAPASAKEKNKTAEPVACSGVFGYDSSEKLLIETYGKDNVVTGNVDGPEGTQLLATTVFPDDLDKKMVFFWADDATRDGLSSVDLAPTQVAPFGIRVGMTAAEVEAINGAPFTIGGFWWDYGGYAGFVEGKLAGPLDGECYLSLQFSPPDEISPAIDVTPISGDVRVPSDEGLLEVLGVRITQITLGYAFEPGADD